LLIVDRRLHAATRLRGVYQSLGLIANPDPFNYTASWSNDITDIIISQYKTTWSQCWLKLSKVLLALGFEKILLTRAK